MSYPVKSSAGLRVRALSMAAMVVASSPPSYACPQPHVSCRTCTLGELTLQFSHMGTFPSLSLLCSGNDKSATTRCSHKAAHWRAQRKQTRNWGEQEDTGLKAKAEDNSPVG